jgi:recombinational DNA repair protein RecR
MIPREKAHLELDLSRERQEKRIGLHRVIDEIYDSIGSCKECVYRCDENTTQWCDKLEKIISLDWYCGDFERRNDDSKN